MQYSRNVLESEIAQLFGDEDVVLLEMSVSSHNGRHQLRIIGDRRSSGLTIDDCVNLSRQVQHLIAEKSLITGEYRLEVSSPGLDYPLRHEWQFGKNLGRLVKITVRGERGPREINGRLTAVDSAGITLTADKTEWQTTYTEILSAKVLPEFHSPRTETKQ